MTPMVVNQCVRTWRRLGVSKEVADEMAAELGADLESAAAEGLSATSVVGSDARGFAATWAFERGVVRPRLRLGLTAFAALVGAVPGVGFGLFVAYGLSSDAMGSIFGAGEYRVGNIGYRSQLDVPEWLLLALYIVGAVFAYAGAVGAVAAVLHWRFDPALARTVRSLATALPVCTAAAVGAAVLFASSRDFATSMDVVFADAAVAATVLALGVALVRYRAVRRERARSSAEYA
ncbi:MAG: hypothetical protein QOF43_1536 [Gaiellaceae bacterium]|nr:hypothetical protein [Gaiellaceae bacterium]